MTEKIDGNDIISVHIEDILFKEDKKIKDLNVEDIIYIYKQIFKAILCLDEESLVKCDYNKKYINGNYREVLNRGKMYIFKFLLFILFYQLELPLYDCDGIRRDRIHSSKISEIVAKIYLLRYTANYFRIKKRFKGFSIK